MAKLKAAKEEADAKQAQTQREMKEELERLRTSFMFKVLETFPDALNHSNRLVL